jgi:hypothetical protein
MSDPTSKPAATGVPAHSARPAPAASNRVTERLDALGRQVDASIAAMRPEESAAALEELLRIAPDNPKVQLRARSAAMIGFSWPLAREACAPRPAQAPLPGDLDLVAFHADLPLAPSGVHEPIDYMAALALSMEAAAHKAPQARRILLTDEATQVPGALPVHEVRRFPMDRSRLMYERMRAQAAYLRDRPTGRCSILLDSDVVVNREPSAVFAEAFDVGLTWRPEIGHAPFNGGVIFIAQGNAGLAFFGRTLACYDALAADARVASRFPHDLRAWWGDQLALAAMVGYREFAANRGAGVRVEGVTVRFFACSEYNFVPKPGVTYPAEVLRAKFFVHFKGNRKASQSRYVELMRDGWI